MANNYNNNKIQKQNTETKNNKQKINQQSNKRIHVPTTIYATLKKKQKHKTHKNKTLIFYYKM